MKKNLLTLFALILLVGTSCQEKIDIEKEKEAIKAVIEEETNAFFDKDYDRFAASYVQNESNIRLDAGKNGYWYIVGWEEMDSIFKQIFEKYPDPRKHYQVKTNYKIQVYKESAFAIFDNELHNSEDELIKTNIHVEFLEKVNGEWKIAYLSEIHTSSYEEEIEEGEGEPETEETE